MGLEEVVNGVAAALIVIIIVYDHSASGGQEMVSIVEDVHGRCVGIAISTDQGKGSLQKGSGVLELPFVEYNLLGIVSIYQTEHP